jgi:hypothetical protein
MHDEKHHVIYDLDDTLGHFTDGFVHFMQTYVLDVEPCKIEYPPQYHLMEPFKHLTHLTAEEALKLYEESNTMHYMEPTEIIRIYNANTFDPAFQTTILTARGWMKSGELSVVKWLEYWHLPPPDHIKVVGLRDSKADYVAGLDGHVNAVFDDNPHHLQQYWDHNPKNAIIFIADRPWNQDSPGTTRLNTYPSLEF